MNLTGLPKPEDDLILGMVPPLSGAGTADSFHIDDIVNQPGITEQAKENIARYIAEHGEPYHRKFWGNPNFDLSDRVDAENLSKKFELIVNILLPSPTEKSNIVYDNLSANSSYYLGTQDGVSTYNFSENGRKLVDRLFRESEGYESLEQSMFMIQLGELFGYLRLGKLGDIDWNNPKNVAESYNQFIAQLISKITNQDADGVSMYLADKPVPEAFTPKNIRNTVEVWAERYLGLGNPTYSDPVSLSVLMPAEKSRVEELTDYVLRSKSPYTPSKLFMKAIEKEIKNSSRKA